MSDKRVEEPSGDEQVRTSYTAWNGDERPWPPPENWYRAADGRWWHPAYGPDEQADSLPVWNATDRSSELSSTEPSPEPRPAPDPRSPGTNTDADAELDTDIDTEETDEVEGEAADDAHVDIDIDDRQRSQRRLLAMIAIGVLGLAAAAQIVLGGATADDNAGDPNNEPAAATTSDDLETSAGEQDRDGESAGGSSSTRAERQAADGGDDPGAAAAVESDPEVAGAVADFRRAMSEHGLSTDELTDDDITTFASTYCVYAGGAEDRAAFDELRRLAVATSQSDLSPTQLNLTITTAITVFCPAESDRLGISSDPSAP